MRHPLFQYRAARNYARPFGARGQIPGATSLDDVSKARRRPVGVAIDKSGALLVADDVGNTVWRVTSR
jgi:glucose/arabinose dehydrogenase